MVDLFERMWIGYCCMRIIAIVYKWFYRPSPTELNIQITNPDIVLEYVSPITIYEEIDTFDHSFFQQPVIANQRYIGSYKKSPMTAGSVVSNRAFFHYSYRSICRYLMGYIPIQEDYIHIIQIVGPISEDATVGDMYFYNLQVVLKTHWIRLIQRKWKKMYQEKKRVLEYRKSLACQREFELTGKYPAGYNYYPMKKRYTNI